MLPLDSKKSLPEMKLSGIIFGLVHVLLYSLIFERKQLSIQLSIHNQNINN